MQTPLCIGITGGIATGKSTVCRIFATLGIPIYEADSRAKWLMQHDTKLKTSLIAEFGEATYNEAGELNRPYLAAKVFTNQAELAKLNALVHPRVGEDFRAWIKQHSQAPYLLNEAALMFESGRFKDLDAVITVSAPLDLRISRVKARDPQRSEAEIKGIIAKQMPEEEKLARADYVIYNDGSRLLIPQVIALHEKFSKIKI